MRDNRFVAEHRGGSLTKDQHRLLVQWARKCSEHVISIITTSVDPRLTHALLVSEEWENGDNTVGAAREASVGAIAVARAYTNPIDIAVARSVGHAVATVHMSDHCLHAAVYALKAVQLAGRSVDDEIEWQHAQVPEEVRDLVYETMPAKEKGL